MLNEKIINKVERLRSEAEELWPLSDTQRKLDIRLSTLELKIKQNLIYEDLEQYMEELKIARREYGNARSKFIDNYIFSRL